MESAQHDGPDPQEVESRDISHATVTLRLLRIGTTAVGYGERRQPASLSESASPTSVERMEAAEVGRRELNRWVNWLRRTYGLSASVVPPFWHRHAELVWDLSALHLHWLCAYDPDQHGSTPLGWHRDFAEGGNVAEPAKMSFC